MAFELNRFAAVRNTQSAADTPAQSTMSTGLSSSATVGWEIKSIEFLIDPTQLAALSADSEIEIEVSRDAYTSAPPSVRGLTDESTIMAWSFANMLTTSGEVFTPTYFKWEAPSGVVVVQPNLYFTVDSNATGQTLVTDFRINFSVIKLSEIEFLRLLTGAG